MHTPAPALAALCALVAGASCTSTPELDPKPAATRTRRAPTPEDERAGAAIRSLRDGRWQDAHELAGALLADQYLFEASVLLDEGRPEDGLIVLDKLLALEPDDQEARFQKGTASLMLAEKSIAQGGSALLVEGALMDALDYFQLDTPRPEALFGASRSAWLLSDIDRALELARAGMQADESPDESELKIFSEVAFGAYTQAKSGSGSEEEAAVLFAELADALSRLLGRTPTDAWAWGRLADLYEWEERYGEARQKLDAALARVPEDASLLERLARVTRRERGAEGAIEALVAHNAAYPETPLGLWYEAKERFDHATAQLYEENYLIGEYQLAEACFQRCRELEQDYEAACRGFEIMCRDGMGWCHFQSGEIEKARDAFLSMNEVQERGLEWRIEGRLLSGVDGLQFVGGEYNSREDWRSAAEVFETLRQYQPEDARWANNAGFFYRDASVELELVGRTLCRAASGRIRDETALAQLREIAGVSEEEAGGPREAELFHAAASEAMSEARKLMEKSRLAYLDAARLAPEDVRIVNDAALVLVYYLHTDLELAEELLLRCVKMGEEQLANEELDEDATWELKNAWGDAFQNLGVLYAVCKDDCAGAVPWFERSVEIGPEPRPLLTEFWLPLVKGEREETPQDEMILLKNWAEPCSQEK